MSFLKKIIRSMKIKNRHNNVPLPNSILIDPINICNLKCPLCPVGTGKINVKNPVMSIQTFKIIIDKIPSLKHITLCNWGEPFLNPDIFWMIKYAGTKNIRSLVHSNFSFPKDKAFFINIVESGLNRLTISLDGASQESYSKYRIGGDFNLVISNIKELIAVKNQLNKETPWIEWKFIINKYNEDEINMAKEMAQSLGLDFRTHKIGLSDDLPDLKFDESIEERKKKWLPRNGEYIYDFYKGQYKFPLHDCECKQLFNLLVVGPDGDVFPCCWITDQKNSFGNLLKESLEDIWYNIKYNYSRSLFENRSFKPKKIRTICSTCNKFKRRMASPP